MTNPDDITRLEQRRRDARRRLLALELQQARLGVFTPPEIVIAIEETQAEISQIEAQLDAAGVLTDNTPGPAASGDSLPWRNRRALLDRVEQFWVKDVLQQSLGQGAPLELALRYEPAAVDSSWQQLVQLPAAQRVVVPGTSIGALFDELGGQLLMLGAAGAGKTTLLLTLARELIARARRDPEQPVPVVFALGSWNGNLPTLESWLARELHERYDVPPTFAARWAASDACILLLDGLDEVAEAQRATCVAAINAYRQAHSTTPLVVSSRADDYLRLPARLRLYGALMVPPLARADAEHYLRLGGTELAAVRAALDADPSLWELLDNPLMLNVVARAYAGSPPDELRLEGTSEQRRQQLFAAYVAAMFRRRGVPTRYLPEQMTRWLAWLAHQMIAQHQPVFYIERMQPTWLAPSLQRRFDRIVGVGRGMLVGLAVGIIAGAFLLFALGIAWPGLGIRLSAPTLLLAAGVGGLLFATALALVGWRAAARGPTEQIHLVEQLYVPPATLRNGLIFGTAAGLLAGAVAGYAYGLLLGLLVAFALGAALALLLMARDASWREEDDELRMRPNQGIARSTRNALVVSAAVGLASGAAIALLLGLVLNVGIGAALGGVLGVAVAIFMALFFGGEAYLKHWLLRALLWRQGLGPWEYPAFLDEGVARVFLRRVGGGYLFIHRLLMEYFAGSTPKLPGSSG